MGAYYLMQKNEPLLSFDLEEGIYEVLAPSLIPYSLRGRINKPDRSLSVMEQARVIQRNHSNIISFLARRTITMSRQNAKEILNAFACSQSQTDEDRAQIAIDHGGVCCGDKYWIKGIDENVSWEEIDPNNYDTDEEMIQISLFGKSMTPNRRFKSPELSTLGSYAKAWICDKGDLYLYKRSDKRREAEIEVEVSNILDCMNVDHVEYERVKYAGEDMCRCRNMADESRSIVTAEELYNFCDRSDGRFMELVMAIDPENIYKMCIVDYLISNPDRHMQNWGFFQAVETGILQGTHPLFDHNRAFDEMQMENGDGGESLVFRNQSKRDVARLAKLKCGLHFIKIPDKGLFFDDSHYDSFIERAGELGML